MIKLTCAVVLLTALSCGNGEIGIFIQVEHNQENLVNLPWVVAKAGDNFILRCRLIGNKDDNIDQVRWKTNSNNIRFIDPNKPFELSFKSITLDEQKIYVCGNKDESKAINILVYNNAKEKVLHDKQRRDVQYFDNEVPQSNADDDKTMLELLESLNKPETTEASDVNSYNNLPNINWNNIHEINDNWPSNLQWSPPETNKYPLIEPLNFTIDDINIPSFKFDTTDVQDDSYEYRTSFTHIYYGIPLAILLILTGTLRVCCANAKRSDRHWERLASGNACQHRICNRRRNTNPSAGCMLEGRDASRFSVLIIRRFTTIGSGSNNNNSNNNEEANEAPPSYEDSTRNLVDNASAVGQSDLPPPYSEVLANVPTGDGSNLRDTIASPVVDELPKPHTTGASQQV